MKKKSTNEEFAEKGNKRHPDLYDYIRVIYLSSREKVEIGCKKCHEWFWQTPNDHLSGCGCPKCGATKRAESKKGDEEWFKEKSDRKHDSKFDHSRVVYVDSQTKVELGCKEPGHGFFWQTPANHLRGHGCPKCAGRRNGDVELFAAESNIVHDNKYGYLKVILNLNDKVEIDCPEHGSFWQTPTSHLQGCGCPKCKGEKVSEERRDTTEGFVFKAIGVHGEDACDYSRTLYKSSKEKVEIGCKKGHGYFWQIPNSHLMGHGCPSCSKGVSDKEREILNFVKSLGFNAEAGSRTLIGDGREVDIYVPEKGLAIEYNGLHWHSEKKGKDKDYHLSKTNLLAEKGIRLIHIFEDEMIHKKDIVLARLRNILVDLPKIHARKCEIREILPKVKNEFLEKTHIQGADRASVSLGAYHGEELVAVMTFCKARVALGRKGAKNEGVIELSRFSTVPDFRVVGIAGKLLKFYERKYSPKEIISYADRRWSEGGLYEALGFTKVHNSKPNYWYCKPNVAKSKTTYMRRIHRFNFARHRLEKYFGEVFPKEKTEREIMQEKGFDKVWDCGNILFSKKYE